MENPSSSAADDAPESGGSVDSGNDHDFFSRLGRHPRWKVAVGASTLVAALAGVLGTAAAFLALRPDGDSSPTVVGRTSTTPPDVLSDQHSPSTSVPTEGRELAVGTCLDRSTTPVPCQSPHDLEVVSLDGCRSDVFVRYLGGDPAREVLRVSPRQLALMGGGKRLCVVGDPTSEPDISSVRGVLATDHADGWRVCVDSRLERRPVPCSDDHTGEYVGIPANQPLDCVRAAEAYMNATYGRVAGELRIVTHRRADGPRCEIEALGSNLLTASVRDIGVSTLPIVADR
jgi:hypothetical protein